MIWIEMSKLFRMTWNLLNANFFGIYWNSNFNTLNYKFFFKKKKKINWKKNFVSICYSGNRLESIITIPSKKEIEKTFKNVYIDGGF